MADTIPTGFVITIWTCDISGIETMVRWFKIQIQEAENVWTGFVRDSGKSGVWRGPPALRHGQWLCM